MFHDFPPDRYALLEGRDHVVLLETCRYDSDNHRSFLFLEPIDSLSVDAVESVPELLERVERYVGRNFYVAGYVGYECGYAFERIAQPPRTTGPLAWFGVYRAPLVFDHLTGAFEGGPVVPADPARGEGLHDWHAISDLHCRIEASEYARKIEAIKAHIRAGNTYQVNFTTKYVFDFRGSALSFYAALKLGQRVSYGAFIRAGGRTVVSLSPELFFRRAGDTIVAKPMKGTVKRGRTSEEDRALREWLGRDVKNRAENVMVVDLLRNDLGRISETGSVAVRGLFAVEKYHTLFQMVSTVEGRLRPGATYHELFRSLFPSGSVTGAPKIRSMQIIRELEAEGRGVYTGAIGYFAPGRQAVFNVAIRTVVIEGGRGEMGVGSGVVWDSDPGEEYRECQLKAVFLTTRHEGFGLIETLLWDNGYPLLRYHLRRIVESAAYFDYPCDPEQMVEALASADRQFASGKRYRVRLVLDRRGRISVESAALEDRDESRQPRVALSAVRTDPTDRFLYHKTTRRAVYDAIHRAGAAAGFADVIFMNEDGEVTEGAISNVFIRRGGELLTPLVRCGLLPGVYRQYMLDTRLDAREAVLTLEDLRGADTVYICNAVRGLREVTLAPEYVEPAPGSEPPRPEPSSWPPGVARPGASRRAHAALAAPWGGKVFAGVDWVAKITALQAGAFYAMRNLLAGLALGSLLLSFLGETAEGRSLLLAVPGRNPASLPVLMLDDGTGYVLLDRLARLLEVKPAWTDKSTKASFKIGGRTAQLTKDRAQVLLDGKSVRLSAPVRVLSDGWAVPEDFLSKVLPRLSPGVMVTKWQPPPVKPVVKSAAAAKLTDLRFRSYPSFTRVVVEADGAFSFHIESGSSEVRVRLSGLAVDQEELESPDDGLIRELSLDRVGSQVVLRVSLEGQLGETKTSILRDPYRLVLDFHRARDRSQTRVQAEPLRLIALDAGHGGHDSGAIGPRGLQEKEVVLDITKRLARMLESGLGVKVALTRTGDHFVPLPDRTAFANAQRADLFVSIHANAHRDSGSEGVETYFLSSEASDSEARQVAALENGVIQLESPSSRRRIDILKTILWDLAQSEFQAESSQLAETVQDSLTLSLALPNRGVKQAAFYVLGGVAMPAILVEVGFVTNKKEERRLQDPAYRERVARAIYAGLAEYKRRYDQKMKALLTGGSR